MGGQHVELASASLWDSSHSWLLADTAWKECWRAQRAAAMRWTAKPSPGMSLASAQPLPAEVLVFEQHRLHQGAVITPQAVSTRGTENAKSRVACSSITARRPLVNKRLSSLPPAGAEQHQVTDKCCLSVTFPAIPARFVLLQQKCAHSPKQILEMLAPAGHTAMSPPKCVLQGGL